jgi:hypothetical protein
MGKSHFCGYGLGMPWDFRGMNGAKVNLQLNKLILYNYTNYQVIEKTSFINVQFNKQP